MVSRSLLAEPLLDGLACQSCQCRVGTVHAVFICLALTGFWHSLLGIRQLRIQDSVATRVLAAPRALGPKEMMSSQMVRWVQFFHKTDPALWQRVSIALQAFAQRGEAGAFVTSEQILDSILTIRQLAGATSTLQALGEAIAQVAELQDEKFHPNPSETFGRLARFVLEIPILFDRGLIMLTQGETRRVHLTRRHVAALLAASLFNALPGPLAQMRDGKHEDLELQPFDLTVVLQDDRPKSSCLFAYFQQITFASEEMLGEVISFSRRSEKLLVNEYWHGLEKPLLPVSFVERGTIEKSAANLQANFANRYLGGGVLNLDLEPVQEEIRFSICPECIVGLLFCEAMLDSETIFIVGTRQYSEYTGYGRTFDFAGMCPPGAQGTLDQLNRRSIHIVAFDAIDFPASTDRQYTPPYILRELMKAHVACMGDVDETDGERRRGFATGNWGCGVFGGDPQLKSLIQWIAASAAGRELVYFPFGDPRVKDLPAVVRAVQTQRLQCSDLYHLLLKIEGCRAGDVFAAVRKMMRVRPEQATSQVAKL